MSQSNLQTDQARARWAAEYRAGRSAYRFFERFRDRVMPHDESDLPSFYPARLDATRHHGDTLTWVCEGLCKRNVACHRSLLNVLRHYRAHRPVRLPA